MRVIPTRVHGVMDYLIGVLLILAPWLFNFDNGGLDTWVPVLLGAGVIIYSLYTDYELGMLHSISMPTHLSLDLVGGVLLGVSPWLFGFAHRVWEPHVILGLIEIGTSLMTRRPVGLAGRAVGEG
jgi:hypothetical protein